MTTADEKLCHPGTSHISLLAIFIVALFAQLAHCNVVNIQHKKIPEKIVESCGPRSLNAALSLLGHSVDIYRCAELAGTDDNGVTTMAGLLSASRVLSKPAKGMHLSPKELALINNPALLHVSLPDAKEHFMVFASSDGINFELIDPLSKSTDIRQFYTADQLRLMWKGDCLVFTPRPLLTSIKIGLWRARGVITVLGGLIVGMLGATIVIAKLSKYHYSFLNMNRTMSRRFVVAAISMLVVIGVVVCSILVLINNHYHSNNPNLVLGITSLNIGKIKLGKSFQTSIWLCNFGKGNLEIDKKKIKKSCKCIGVELSKYELSSGEKTQMKIRLNPPRKLAPFEYSVFIPSSNYKEQSKPSFIKIKGQVIGPGGIVYPPRLYFDRISNTEEVRKELAYIVRRDGVKILNVTSDSPFVTCNFQRISHTFKIEVLLTKLPKLGPFNGIIKIVTNDPDPDYTEIKIPFYGEVIPQAKT